MNSMYEAGTDLVTPSANSTGSFSEIDDTCSSSPSVLTEINQQFH